jgi:thiol-disulfide isomerase/thioredoxin
MKHLILIAFLIVSNLVNAGEAKLSGKLSNAIFDRVIVSYYTNLVNYSEASFETKLKTDGSFSMTIPLPGEEYIRIHLKYGGQTTEIFLKSGFDINITVDGNNFDSTIMYTGKGAEVANLMARHKITSGKMMTFGEEAKRLSLKPLQEFIIGINSVKQKEIDFIENNKKDVPDDFIKFWKTWYQYSAYSELINYTYRNQDGYKIMREVPVVFNDDYIQILPYLSYVNNIYECRYIAHIKGDTTIRIEAAPTNKEMAINTEVKKNMPTKTREYFMANKLFWKINNSPLTEVEKLYADFRSEFKTTANDSILGNKIALKRKMIKGRPALDFEFTTLEYEQMKLSDLKGKVVYIDFWASWCTPCLRQLPAMKKIKEYFKDKDVVFLNISIDVSPADWRIAIEQYGITGINTCSPGERQSPLALKYDIQGVPSYFIIDRNGNFATDQAPAPGEQLIKEIEKLL